MRSFRSAASKAPSSIRSQSSIHNYSKPAKSRSSFLL
jgi:hypothetical protein